jgi:uroporphyrinogen-III synthase
MRSQGVRVWITRTQPGADRTAVAVREAGFDPVVAALLAVRSLEPAEDIATVVDGIAALAFTSVNGLAFADLIPRRDWPVFAVGDRTAEAARQRGFQTVISAGGDARDLTALIASEWRGRNGALLIPTAAQPAADMGALLQGRVPTRTVAIYETVETQTALPEDFDIVLIHSVRAAQILARRLEPSAAHGRTAIALSKAIAAPLRSLGFADLRIPLRPDEAGLLEALGKAPPAV